MPKQVKNMEVDNQGKVKMGDLLLSIQEVLVPVNYLPVTIPVYQRLKDAPYKFRVITVAVKRRHAYWASFHYFMTDGEGLIDIADRYMYYRTRTHNKFYKLKIDEKDLPKELKTYTKGLCVDVKEYEDEINVFVYLHNILSIQGDLPLNCDEKTFVVSVLFHLLPHLSSLDSSSLKAQYYTRSKNCLKNT